jgi:hypothetical protein
MYQALVSLSGSSSVREAARRGRTLCLLAVIVVVETTIIAKVLPTAPMPGTYQSKQACQNTKGYGDCNFKGHDLLYLFIQESPFCLDWICLEDFRLEWSSRIYQEQSLLD